MSCMAEQDGIVWDSGAAAHLLRRAAFGCLPEGAGALASLGLKGAVEKLLAPPIDALPPPPTDPAEMARQQQLRRARRVDRKENNAELAAFQREQRAVTQDLRYWWLERMRAETGAAREKLALFWHGHFATSQTKVKCNRYMFVQNETLRRLAMRPFGELCAAMARDPAMLVWLDGRDNSAKAPNENFAREIMELFTLGEGHYSEEDIREAARCFTGWRVNPENGESFLVPRRHDAGEKSLFGKTGNFGTDETVGIICSQPRCAEFIAGKLWEFYAYANPAPQLVDSLAAHFRNHDLDTGELLRAIFNHPEFYSPRARATQIKSPVQWLVQAARETGRRLLPPGLALPLGAELGQNLFMPPSVKGWDGGPAWINSATLISRSNTARLFAVAAAPLPEAEAASMDAAAWTKVAPQSARTDADALEQRLRRVFLAGPVGKTTRQRVRALLDKSDFPCGDETVREASIVLLASPEYNLC